MQLFDIDTIFNIGLHRISVIPIKYYYPFLLHIKEQLRRHTDNIKK